MPKFGELINFQKPVLIDFYADYGDLENTIKMLRSVAAGLGDLSLIHI